MPVPSFLAFLGLVLSVLLGAHALLYASLVHFFSPPAFWRSVLFWTLAFLSVSFIAASLLARLEENVFTRSFYFASGVWLGTLTNLVLASAAAWASAWALRRIWTGFPASPLAAVLLGLAALVSAYGVWNALHPRVRNVTVEIPGLPEAWKGRRIVQLSDIHLGHVYQHGFLRRVVERVNEAEPKAVVVTGDLFDGMDGPLGTFVEPLDDIRSEGGVLFVTGNHETYLGLEKAFGALGRTNVRILRDEVEDIDGLAFLGVDYPQRGEKKDVVATAARLAAQAGDKPSVLLYHSPHRVEAMAETGVDLQLSGHTHRGQQFPFGLVARLAHKGYEYGLYRLGGFSLYVTSGVGTWGPTMRVGTSSEIVVMTLR
jgi:predicted MPP superfamily phosphohydrolase